MSVAGRWFITPHAVNQYRQRFARRLTYEDALAELIRLSEAAHYVKETHAGAQQWRGPKPGRLRMIVQPNPEPLLPTLVTVLPFGS